MAYGLWPLACLTIAYRLIALAFGLWPLAGLFNAFRLSPFVSPMHEYSIVQSLLTRVEAEAASRRATAVRALTLRIGELSGVEPALLQTAFETFVEKTICEGAELSIIRVPVSWACPRCERPIAQGAFLQCPECSVPATLRSGDEIILERIEMEVPDV